MKDAIIVQKYYYFFLRIECEKEEKLFFFKTRNVEITSFNKSLPSSGSLLRAEYILSAQFHYPHQGHTRDPITTILQRKKPRLFDSKARVLTSLLNDEPEPLCTLAPAR